MKRSVLILITILLVALFAVLFLSRGSSSAPSSSPSEDEAAGYSENDPVAEQTVDDSSVPEGMDYSDAPGAETEEDFVDPGAEVQEEIIIELEPDEVFEVH